MYREIVVQGRTVPLEFELFREGTREPAGLAGATVRLSLVRMPHNFLGASQDPPYRADGPDALYVDEDLVEVLDQQERPGWVRWDPGEALVEIPPADYAVRFRVRFAAGQVEYCPALGELVLEVVP